MKSKAIALSLCLLLLAACSTHTHVIGNGPSTGVVEEARQWYALFGLVKLNKVDTGAMVGDATDYQIEDGVFFMDGLIGGLAGAFIPTLSCRSVKVTK